MTGGLTPTGFVAKTQQEIASDINTDLLTNLSSTLDLSPDQGLGQIVGSVAEEAAEIWEVVATVYNAMNPDAAENQLLDNICAITGTRRRSATFSTTPVLLNLNAGVTVPAGSSAYVSGQPQNIWVATADIKNTGGSPANIAGTFRSQTAGPFVANASTLTVIASPISGWNSIINTADATVGIPEDSDPVLRVRREEELGSGGSTTADAIRAAVLLVPGVIQCFVFENDEDVVDANGVPAHATRVVIWDGISPAASNNAVAQAIWNEKGSGVKTYGGVSGVATDSLGNSRTVLFDRAQQVRVYMSCTTTPSTLTTAQTAAVKTALVNYGLSVLNLGVEVVALAFRAQALTVTGIIDVPTFTLGTTPSPTGTANILISGLQIATLASGDIKVNGI